MCLPLSFLFTVSLLTLAIPLTALLSLLSLTLQLQPHLFQEMILILLPDVNVSLNGSLASYT